MCFAGYKFAVVYNAFMFHQGLKTGYGDTSIVVAARNLATKRNDHIMKQFEQRLRREYGANPHKCLVP